MSHLFFSLNYKMNNSFWFPQIMRLNNYTHPVSYRKLAQRKDVWVGGGGERTSSLTCVVLGLINQAFPDSVFDLLNSVSTSCAPTMCQGQCGALPTGRWIGWGPCHQGAHIELWRETLQNDDKHKGYNINPFFPGDPLSNYSLGNHFNYYWIWTSKKKCYWNSNNIHGYKIKR